MKKYYFEVTALFRDIFAVEANSIEEAKTKLKFAFEEEKIHINTSHYPHELVFKSIPDQIENAIAQKMFLEEHFEIIK